MKKHLSAFALALVVALPVAAGDVNMPPEAPPPCRENCGNSITAQPIKDALILLAIKALTRF